MTASNLSQDSAAAKPQTAQHTTVQNIASAHSRARIARAAGVVLLGFFASGLLGLIRNVVLSATFGAGSDLDAFYAGGRIPEAIYVLVAGGALGSSFIPVFARFLTWNDIEKAWRLASAVLTIAAVVATIAAGLFALGAESLVPLLLVPGKPPGEQALAVSLTQILMITVPLFSISGLLMGLLNANGNFTLPALALSMNNVGQIIGALVLAPQFGIYGVAYGAVLGAVLHLAIQLPGLRAILRANRAAGARLRLLPDTRTEGAAEVLLLMLPRLAGLAAVQVNFAVNTSLASGMAEGSLTAFTIAWTLMFFALGIIAQSVGTAVFPALSALASAGDMVGFRDRLAGAMRGVLLLACPVMVGLILLGQPAIAVLLERGEWTAEHTAGAAWALAWLGTGIIGHSLLEVLARGFYALSDTRTPVLIGIGSIVLNVAFSLLFIRVIGDPASLSRGAFGGLAWANALSTLLEAFVLWLLLARRAGAIAGVLPMFARAAAAAGVMAGILAALSALIAAPLPLLIVAGGGGLLAYFAAAVLFGVEEARTVPRLFLRRLRSS